MDTTVSPDVLVGPAVRVLMSRGLTVQASVAALFAAAEELGEDVGVLAALVVAYEQQQVQLARSSGRSPGGNLVLVDEDPSQPVQSGRQSHLSERESDVIAGIAHGLSNQEIADQMYLSINSVKTHLRSAYRKCGVTSRSEAVLWGIDHGLGPPLPRLTTA